MKPANYRGVRSGLNMVVLVHDRISRQDSNQWAAGDYHVDHNNGPLVAEEITSQQIYT